MRNCFIVATAAVALGGCMFNMPTPPSQITGAYVSPVKYENLDCVRLQAELDSIVRREAQATAAQQQRVKSSQVQAFWLGYGQGDGIEAAELAVLRGEKEAVRTTYEAKSCGTRNLNSNTAQQPAASQNATQSK